MQNILELSISERIEMVEAIWNSIADNEKTATIPKETKGLLDQRLANHTQNPTEGSPWNEVKERLKS